MDFPCIDTWTNLYHNLTAAGWQLEGRLTESIPAAVFQGKAKFHATRKQDRIAVSCSHGHAGCFRLVLPEPQTSLEQAAALIEMVLCQDRRYRKCSPEERRWRDEESRLCALYKSQGYDFTTSGTRARREVIAAILNAVVAAHSIPT